MRLKALIFTCALVVTALCGLAFGAVRVYQNKFESKADAKELSVSGKGCKAEVRGNKGQLGVSTPAGHTRCRLRLPVFADGSQPDQIVDVEAKLLPKTPEQIRKKVYVGLTVREGAGGYYELRLYPDKQKFTLNRKPGGDGFPITAKDKKIGETGEKNKLTLRAIGDVLSAKMNKKQEEFADPQPGALPGTKISMIFAQEGGSSEGASAWFKDLRVSVPNP